MVTALLGIIILAGLAVVFVATATTESRMSGISRDYESAIHVAEAGIDDLIPQVNTDPATFFSTDADGDPYVFDPDDIDSLPAERQWVLSLAEAVPEEDLVQLARGESFAFRPVMEVGGDVQPVWVMYSVGWVPSRAEARRTRIVKVQFDSQRFRLDAGLLVGGDMHFSGDACVKGDLGSTHANGDIQVSGGGGEPGICGPGAKWSVEQTISTSGSFDGLTCDPPPTPVGSCEEGAERYPIPRIRARTLYEMVSLAAPVDPPAHSWYDLCPDGTVRTHGGSGGPCTSTTILWNGSPGNRYRGWRMSGDDWEASGGGGTHPGVYYVYQRNAKVRQSSGTLPAVTVISEADPAGDGNRSGNIDAGADARIQSALAGLTLVADRDVVIGGNIQIHGLVTAHEQVQLGGEPIITGAVVAQDARNTINSPVDCGLEDSCPSDVRGQVTIIYDDELNPPLGGRIRITHWNEL